MADKNPLCVFFHQALQLNDDWSVDKVALNKDQKRLLIWISFVKGRAFDCPECGTKTTWLHSAEERVFRHLNFFENRTELYVKAPRIECPHCHHTHVVYPGWLCRKESGFTLLFQGLTMRIAKVVPLSVAAQILEIGVHIIERLVACKVEQARAALDFSNVRKVGVDETSCAKGHKYMTTFVDLVAGQLLFATPGKSKDTVRAFRDELCARGLFPDQIEEFSSDLSTAFVPAIKECFPGARLTLDKFHLVKLVNDAVDQVRRDEATTFKDVLKRSRYLWLKNRENLTAEQNKRLEEICLHNRHLKTIRAWRIRIAFQEVFEALSPEEGTTLLKQWYWWASHSRLKPLQDAARTIKRHWDNVIHWFKARISNGLLEGMNSLIQVMKGKVRGFRNVQTMITMSYLAFGQLSFDLPE